MRDFHAFVFKALRLMQISFAELCVSSAPLTS
jgi:hypothetical protein